MATNNSVNNASIGTMPGFMAYLASSDINQTGNGAIFTLGNGVNLTIAFDRTSNMNVNGTFTAPTTGYYLFTAALQFTGLVVASVLTISIVTTGKTYTNSIGRSAVGADFGHTISILAPMTSGNTAVVTGVVTGELGDTADAIGNSDPVCFFSGFLIN